MNDVNVSLAYFESWSTWTTCSKTCDSGSRTRERTCTNGDVGEVGCDEADGETEVCNADVECCKFYLLIKNTIN